MKLVGQRLLTELEPLAIGNTEMRVELHEPRGQDGAGIRRNLYFTRAREQRYAEKHPSGDTTRLSFLSFNEERALFIGMAIRKTLRGSNLGHDMFDYFRDYMKKEDLGFIGTGKIHKPLIALLLTRQGLEPRSDACMAEVLTTSQVRSPVPWVRFLRNDLPPEQIVAGSCHGPFYEVALPEAVATLPVNEEHVVALHTSYRPA